MNHHDLLSTAVADHRGAVCRNADRATLIQHVIDQRAATVTPAGNLATLNPADSTGRSPQDTYIVRHAGSEESIDWSAPNNIAMTPDLFDSLFADALETLKQKSNVYVADRTVGADPSYALPVHLVTDRPLTTLFAANMFREVPDSIGESIFAELGFSMLVLPYDRIDTSKYEGQLRHLPNGKTSDMVVAMDFDRRIGLIYGCAYCGAVKKLMFTVMNYLLPEHGILPLHCSANEGQDGDVAVILGLSGTGKTTLSADASRPLIGDDEHGWSDNGVANFENGCYAKLIHLNPTKEPEIHRIAIGEQKEVLDSGVIIENAFLYPDGTFDLDDDRLTANSRVSYPLSALQNIKEGSVGGHAQTILFLTADANGVLPPVAKLNADQAMLWFLMGYTSKLAGTETGVTEPKTTFSRFFGAPFMPRNPEDYTNLLKQKISQHNTHVYLINTGWTGGPYGVGQRIDITVTRAIVNAALNGDLETVEYETDERFHLAVPQSCPDVPHELLNPKHTWNDSEQYDKRADKLAQEFSTSFDKMFASVDDAIRGQCPGK